MSETCENWLGIVNSCIYYASQTREIYQVLPYSVNFRAPGELWNPLSKTENSRNKCIYILGKKGHVNILNDRKAHN